MVGKAGEGDKGPSGRGSCPGSGAWIIFKCSRKPQKSEVGE